MICIRNYAVNGLQLLYAYVNRAGKIKYYTGFDVSDIIGYFCCARVCNAFALKYARLAV
jgi:hypothetical protein